VRVEQRVDMQHVYPIGSMSNKVTFLLLLAVAALAAPPKARAWEWLRSRNGNVEEGNAKLGKNDPAGALKAYDKAARELPSSGGVHLDRGLALLAKSDLPAARQALLMATEPPASAEVRAAAYYNLGNAFYKEAEQKASEQNHEEAQKSFQEAADSLRRSLRINPANRDAAWNLELAVRRIQEEHKKEAEKKREEQEKQKQQEQKNHQDQQKQPDQNQPDQKQQDQKQPDQKQQDQQKQPDPKQQDKKPEPKQPDQAQQQKQPEQKPEAEQQRAVPAEVTQALDALQNSEENLERYKARVRAARERRTPEKDW
jgi:Ca-activated chloride channel homolog